MALVLPGAGYTRADLDRIADGAAANADNSLLEIAWSIVSEGGAALNLEAMADLMFGDASAMSQYSAYRMLLDDLVYFKQVRMALQATHLVHRCPVALLVEHLMMAEERYQPRVGSVV